MGRLITFLSVYRMQETVLIYVSMENKVIVEEALENYRKAQAIIGEISDINRELLLRKVNF